MKKVISLFLVVFAVAIVCFSSGCSGKKFGLRELEINGKTVKCDMNMSDVLSNFSELEYEYSESISCAYNGMDKIYDFSDNGFIISTYPDGDKDYVLEISVTSKDIKQNDGKVYVGMSKEDLINGFGSGYVEDGDIVTYSITDKQTMFFIFTDGVLEEYGISVAE